MTAMMIYYRLIGYCLFSSFLASKM